MSRKCLVSQKKILFGNNVSHSNRKTKRIFYPNLHKIKIYLPGLKKKIKINVTAKGLRIIKKKGVKMIVNKFIKGKKI